MKKLSLSSSFSCKNFVDLTFVAHAATWQKFHVECNLKRNLNLNALFQNYKVNNKYDPFAHNLRLEHAKNAGLGSKHSFGNVLLLGTTNSISNF